MLCKDGAIVPVLVIVTPFYDGQANFIATRSTMIDNTERTNLKDLPA